MIEFITQLDTAILLRLNDNHNEFWDSVMWFSSGKFTWLLFYILLTLLLIWKLFERFRPSHNPDLAGELHLVNGYKGGKFGFISFHAANVFSLAFYLKLVACDKLKWMPFVLILWAIFVSRVYLGVHYPTDIIVPAILSIPIALIVARIYKVYNPILIKKII